AHGCRPLSAHARLAVAESVRGTAHRPPPPRVPRPHRGAERRPPASPPEPLSPLLPRCPNTPRPGQGHTGAQTGGAPRSGRHRRDPHGRRPASSVHTPGGVGSFRPAGCPATRRSPVGRSTRFLGLPPPCVCGSTGGVSLGAKAQRP